MRLAGFGCVVALALVQRSAQVSAQTVPPAVTQPAIQNARLETRAVSGSLDAAFRALVTAQPGVSADGSPDGIWIGYATPQVPGERNMCCWNSNASYPGCALEPQIGTAAFGPNPSSTIHLEGAPEFFVLFRVERQAVEKIRSFSPDCAIDAGGRHFYWLTGVKPEESLALLQSLIPPSTSAAAARQLAGSAINAIGLHRDGVPVLIDLARKHPDAEVRRQAVSWLGKSKDARATRFYEEIFAK